MTFVCFYFLVDISDILWSLLCGHQPLQEPAHLFGEHHRDVQREEKAWNASAHLRHLRVGVPLHAPRYDRYFVFQKWLLLICCQVFVGACWPETWSFHTVSLDFSYISLQMSFREVGFIVSSELNCTSNWEKIVLICKQKSQLGRICNHLRRSFDWNVYLICSQLVVLANTGD